MPPDDDALQPALRFFKTLADASRLRILGVLAAGERSVDELAALLELRPPTISHHLAMLRQLGLVASRAQGNLHLYRLDQEALRQLSRDVLNVQRVAAFADSLEAEAWEHKVLRDFFDGERLTQIPASRKKRAVILKRLADEIPIDTRFPERQLNALLVRHHPDPATLRRELVGAGLLQREQSVYWRPATPPATRSFRARAEASPPQRPGG